MRQMQKIETDGNGTILNIIEHIILRNYWEYYIIEKHQDSKDSEIETALVMGFETEIGDVYMPEIKPYVISRTNNLEGVLPPEGWVWL